MAAGDVNTHTHTSHDVQHQAGWLSEVRLQMLLVDIHSDILFIFTSQKPSQETPAVYLGFIFIGIILPAGTFGFVTPL